MLVLEEVEKINNTEKTLAYIQEAGKKKE